MACNALLKAKESVMFLLVVVIVVFVVIVIETITSVLEAQHKDVFLVGLLTRLNMVLRYQEKVLSALKERLCYRAAAFRSVVYVLTSTVISVKGKRSTTPHSTPSTSSTQRSTWVLPNARSSVARGRHSTSITLPVSLTGPCSK